MAAIVGRPAHLPDPSTVDLDAFWAELDARAPWHVRTGFRLSTLVLGSVLPRLWGHGSGLAGLDPAAAEDVVRRAAANPLTSPLCDAAKVVACFAYFADEEVESAVRQGP